MKKCNYCGKEYPDEARVCAIDNEPLTEGSPDLPQVPEDQTRETLAVTGATRRPKGVWIVTIWMFLFAGSLPSVVGLFLFFGPPEHEGVASLSDLVFTLSFAIAVMVASVAAWLGHDWGRYALITMTLSHYSLIAYNVFNIGQSGIVPAAKMHLVWARVVRALITMFFIVSYLIRSQNAKAFFMHYRNRVSKGRD